ncbi:MAG TPA: hypothetical protein PK367_01865 [Candidatus Paceibacterota bacterium]|nr:hypothetical protein [Candidatus Paceibacterota bacterium]
MKAILKKVEDFSSEVSDGELANKLFIKEQKTETDESGNLIETKKEIEVIEPIFIEVDDNTYIKFDKRSNRSETIDARELRSRKQEIETKLLELNDYSDENLLAWAKKNYPTPDGLREKEQLEGELQNITNSLNEINGD